MHPFQYSSQSCTGQPAPLTPGCIFRAMELENAQRERLGEGLQIHRPCRLAALGFVHNRAHQPLDVRIACADGAAKGHLASLTLAS